MTGGGSSSELEEGDLVPSEDRLHHDDKNSSHRRFQNVVLLESQKAEGGDSCPSPGDLKSPDEDADLLKPLTKVRRSQVPDASQISTRDVDPEFLLNYRLETVDFPSSPQHQHQALQVSHFPKSFSSFALLKFDLILSFFLLTDSLVSGLASFGLFFSELHLSPNYAPPSAFLPNYFFSTLCFQFFFFFHWVIPPSFILSFIPWVSFVRWGSLY